MTEGRSKTQSAKGRKKRERGSGKQLATMKNGGGKRKFQTKSPAPGPAGHTSTLKRGATNDAVEEVFGRKKRKKKKK